MLIDDISSCAHYVLFIVYSLYESLTGVPKRDVKQL